MQSVKTYGLFTYACRPSVDGRSSCCIAIGVDHYGVALLTLAFNQHGPHGVQSRAVRLLSHTAPVLRMCVAWDHTPAVCPFPSSSSRPDAGLHHAAAAAAAGSSTSGGNYDAEGRTGKSFTAADNADQPGPSSADYAESEQVCVHVMRSVVQLLICC